LPIPENLPKPTASETAEGFQAIGEAAALAANVDLDDRGRINSLNSMLRDDRKDHHLHRLICAGFYVTGIACLMMFLVLVAHYILPSSRRFLDAEQVEKLQSFLFSGTVGGLLTTAAKRVKGGPGA
jgi:hypothetical protein